MKLNTTRFGDLQVNKTDIVEFKDGLLGFESLKNYFIVDPGDNTLILWLQSIDDGSVAFPIIEPKIYKPDYIAKLLPSDLKSLDLESALDARIYSVLTIPTDITQMSANLKAPVVINNNSNIAKQIVLQDSKLSVNYEMYIDLKRYIVAYSSDDSTRTSVAAPLPATTETTTRTPETKKERLNEL